MLSFLSSDRCRDLPRLKSLSFCCVEVIADSTDSLKAQISLIWARKDVKRY